MEHISSVITGGEPAKQPKKRWFRRRWVWITGAVVLIAVIGAIIAGRGSDETYVTAAVERGDLVQTIEATGRLESVQDIDLAFEVSGTLSNVFVSIGDEVRAGDVLAILRGGSLSAQVNSARQAVAASQARLNQFAAGDTQEAIASLEASVDAASARLDASELDLLQAHAEYALDVEGAYDDLISELRSSMIEVRDALSDADEILGIENTLANDGFENELAPTNTQALRNAEVTFELAAEQRDLIETRVFSLSLEDAHADIEAQIDGVELVLNRTADTLLYTRQVLDATITNSVGLPVADLVARKATINVTRDLVQAQQEALRTAVLAVEDLKISDTVSQAEATLALRRAELAQAEAALSDSVGTRPVDLAVFEADLARAIADLDVAQAQFDKAEISSPIDGRVTDVVFDIGEAVGATLTVLTVQSTGDAFLVTAQVSESDIVKVDLGDTVEVTLDAFGDDVVLEGHVARLAPAEDTIEGVVFYEMDVVFQDDSNRLGLRPGMTADAVVETERIINVFMVPQRAILKTDGRNFVRIPNKGGFEERTVEVGSRGDGGLVEITSGLEGNEEVIISIREK